ncbi:FMN-binding protein MioC [Paraferrimonas haliotis]|uniref:Protein MioC n=1 Tax=Paraferrimonas haliotis TaxID=2013866 RepID=A0AA37TNQ9_9GAMM|nr:FMN-binding protein MioC [Paraferrimonas haliotis]GLS84802.1 protein MioC [Paraferrimonas haliotis]
MEIIVGSTLGNAEFIADEISDLCSQYDIYNEVHTSPNLSELSLDTPWLVITSTHGAGDLPDNLQPFFDHLTQSKPCLSKLKFAVIAIGDSSYDTFCYAGKKMEGLLLDLGAKPIVDKIEIDVQVHPTPEDIATSWASQWIPNQ